MDTFDSQQTRCLRALGIIGTCLVMVACSYQAWYTGLQESQRQECYKSPNESAVQRCLERVNDMDYEDYRRARQDAR